MQRKHWPSWIGLRGIRLGNWSKKWWMLTFSALRPLTQLNLRKQCSRKLSRDRSPRRRRRPGGARHPDLSRFPPRCLPPLLRGRQPRFGRYSQRLEPEKIRPLWLLSLLFQVQTLLHPTGESRCRRLIGIGHAEHY